MVAAVVIACAVMYISSGPVGEFVADHPTTKMLALAFLVLIGVALVANKSNSTSRAAISTLPLCSRRPSNCQRAGRAQPPEGREIAGFSRSVDKAAAMAFVSLRSSARE